MKQLFTHFKGAFMLLLFYGVCNSPSLHAQAVSEIVTDYNGYWKSGVGNLNPIKPMNSHNLVAFSFNGVRYSTGVNDALLTANGDTFSPQDFQALPFLYFTGTPTANTFIGLGQLYDGVHNGGSTPPPINSIPLYLTDGPQGLDIGTCVANIPIGTVNFGVSNVQASSIGDGIPDILITQIAQPSGALDVYSFRDANGSIVGNPVNIELEQIVPVANWIADFYRTTANPMFIPAGFVNTERPIRLWAADLSFFGIDQSNFSQIVSFRVGLKGTSDLAFIAYNYETVKITPLPAGIALQKDGNYIDANNNCIVDLGDTIEYRFIVTNTGESTLTNITVNDPLVTVNGGAISLVAGASNSTNFTATYALTAADIAAGAVYNVATISATNPQNEVLNTTSVDPTPIPTTSPFYNSGCPMCTVTILPSEQVITAPATASINGCSTDVISFLPFSTTSQTITYQQFQSVGGSLSAPLLATEIRYQDVVSGTCPLVVTRTFTIAGCLTQTVTQTINIVDTELPTANTLAPIHVEGCGQAFPTPDTSLITAADNCDSAPVVAFVQDGQPTQNGCLETVIRTYSVTDACGNSISVNQTMTRTNDTVMPTATAPADITILEYNQPIPVADINVITNVADNCGTPVVTYVGDSAPTANGCQETIIRTYHVTDSCNNVLVINQNITRNVDVTAPVATINPITSPCSLTVPAPTAVDACAGVITGTTTDPVTFTEQGVYTINWTFNDGNGNITTVAQSVTVDKTAIPSIGDLPAIQAQCNPSIEAPSVINPCTNESVVGTTTEMPVFNGDGTYVIVWHFDFGGVDVTANQTVVIDDTVSPILPTLETVVFTCGGDITTSPVAMDNCAGEITGTTTDALSFNTPGTYNITWTFNDGNGNIDSATQTVIVHGMEPVIKPLANIVLQCPEAIQAPALVNPCTMEEVFGTTTDNLNPTEEGTYTITWTFNLGYGEPIVLTQTVIIDDTESPALPVLETVSASCQVTVTTPTTTDNCAGTIVGTTSDPLTYSEAGTYIVNWTFVDGNGNPAVVAQQTVIVTPATQPELPPFSAILAQCEYTIPTPYPAVIDPCTTLPVVPVPSATSFNTQGDHVIQWTYNFTSGVATVEQSVTILDNIAPTLVSALEPITASCHVIVPMPEATDNCSGFVTVTTVDPTEYSEAGTYIVNWTLTDAAGNAVTLPQEVTVTTPEAISQPLAEECNQDTSRLFDLLEFLPTGVATGGTFSDPANTGALQGSNYAPYGLLDGTYEIVYSVTDADCTQEVRFSIPVNVAACEVDPACSLSVHNAITPNGDGQNDVMLIEGIADGCYTDSSIEIFNRWGVLVYEARNYNNTTVVFKGQSEGRATLKANEELPAGTYFYILKYKDLEGKPYEKSSYLYISR